MPLLFDRKTGAPTYEVHKVTRNLFAKVKDELTGFTKDSMYSAALRTEATKAIETIDAVLAKFPETAKETATA